MKQRTYLGFLFLLVGTAFAVAQVAPIVAEANGIQFSLMIKGETAEITLSAPYKGWVAVGFDPSSRMKDANVIIGYVKDGKAFARDDFGTSQISHNDDEKLGGRSNLLSYSGTEVDGLTTMNFTIPLDSGDSKDVVLSKGSHTIILGASNSDSFTGFHTKVGKTSIIIP
ncbi:hypothetical protein MASR2M78_11550 [Treponema sp.]